MKATDKTMASGHRVSVVLPTLDCAAFIEASVQSLARQSLEEFECLILDGGSGDGTVAIINRIIAQDSRFRLISWPGSSLVARLNRGIAESCAPLVARMDSDDIAMPERLALQCEAFAARPSLVLLGGQITIIDKAGSPLRKGIFATLNATLRMQLLTCCPFAHPTVMFRRSAVEKVGGYREAFEGAEDHDLWLRLAQLGEIGNLSETLLHYRRHERSMGAMQAQRQALVSALAIEAHHARLALRSDAQIAAVAGEAEIRIELLGDDINQERLTLNHHRMAFLGEALNTAEGCAMLRRFLAHCGNAKIMNQHELADMLVRALAQLVRFRQYRTALYLAGWLASTLPGASWAALRYAVRTRLAGRSLES